MRPGDRYHQRTPDGVQSGEREDLQAERFHLLVEPYAVRQRIDPAAFRSGDLQAGQLAAGQAGVEGPGNHLYHRCEVCREQGLRRCAQGALFGPREEDEQERLEDDGQPHRNVLPVPHYQRLCTLRTRGHRGYGGRSYRSVCSGEQRCPARPLEAVRAGKHVLLRCGYGNRRESGSAADEQGCRADQRYGCLCLVGEVLLQRGLRGPVAFQLVAQKIHQGQQLQPGQAPLASGCPLVRH